MRYHGDPERNQPGGGKRPSRRTTKEQSMNFLTEIPATVRKWLYIGYALLGVVFGAIQVGLQSAEAGFPVWLKVSLSVYAFLGTALGLTAVSNLTEQRPVTQGHSPASDDEV